MKMKVSIRHIIAIVCLLTVGFLTVTPFLPKAEASCNYFTEQKCDEAQAYYVQKLVTAVLICYSVGGAACTEANQDADAARVWSEWVCMHADS